MNVTPHGLGFSLPRNYSPEELPDLVNHLFCIPDFKPEYHLASTGRSGYATRYTVKTALGAELFSILTDGRGDFLQNQTHIDISGLAFEDTASNPMNLDLYHIAREVIAMQGWGTEMHSAIDEFSGLLPWKTILKLSLSRNWKDRIITTLCRYKTDKSTGEKRQTGPVLVGNHVSGSLYFGERESDTSICIYQKGLAEGVKFPWLRVEIRWRNRAAVTDILKRLAAGESLACITAGAIKYNLRFVVPGEKRKGGRDTCKWWADFLGDAEVLKLTRKRDPLYKSPFQIPVNDKQLVEKYLMKKLAGPQAIEIEGLMETILTERRMKF